MSFCLAVQFKIPLDGTSAQGPKDRLDFALWLCMDQGCVAAMQTFEFRLNRKEQVQTSTKSPYMKVASHADSCHEAQSHAIYSLLAHTYAEIGPS